LWPIFLKKIEMRWFLKEEGAVQTVEISALYIMSSEIPDYVEYNEPMIFVECPKYHFLPRIRNGDDPSDYVVYNVPKQHFLLRIGDGDHFVSSSSHQLWGINSQTIFGKGFLRMARKGDLLWFVQSASKGQVIAVATFKGIQPRVLGPIINITPTNEELGWTKQLGEWDIEVHYKRLYDLRDSALHTEIKGAATIRLANDKCKINLPANYTTIVQTLTPTKEMVVIPKISKAKKAKKIEMQASVL